jgi:hypothetical protein
MALQLNGNPDEWYGKILVHCLRLFNILSHFKGETIDGFLDDWIYCPLTGRTTNNYNTIAISTIYS